MRPPYACERRGIPTRWTDRQEKPRLLYPYPLDRFLSAYLIPPLGASSDNPEVCLTLRALAVTQREHRTGGMTMIAIASQPEVETESALGDSWIEPIRYIDDPSFTEPNARRKIFDPAVRLPEPRDIRYRHDNESPRAERSRERDGKLTLTIEQEQALFLRYNYARFRAARAQRFIGRFGPTPRLSRELRRWHRLSIRLRNLAVRFNLRLVLSVIGRMRRQHVEIVDLISEGNVALMRAVENYDHSRGLRFSTYAWKAITNSLRRCHATDGRRRQRFGTPFEDRLETGSPSAQSHERHEVGCCDEVGRILSENRAGLTGLEDTVIRYRFGFAGGDGMTLDQVSQVVGRTRERVRQVQLSAMAKIRRCLDDLYLNTPATGNGEPSCN